MSKDSDKSDIVKITVKTEIEISNEDLRDIMCAGYEGGIYGIGRWFCSTDSKSEPFNGNSQYTSITGVDAEIASESSSDMVGEFHKREHGEMWVIDTDTIAKGIAVLFTLRQRSFSLEDALLSKNIGEIDAQYADTLIQLGLFGEVVYG